MKFDFKKAIKGMIVASALAFASVGVFATSAQAEPGDRGHREEIDFGNNRFIPGQKWYRLNGPETELPASVVREVENREGYRLCKYVINDIWYSNLKPCNEHRFMEDPILGRVAPPRHTGNGIGDYISRNFAYYMQPEESDVRLANLVTRVREEQLGAGVIVASATSTDAQPAAARRHNTRRAAPAAPVVSAIPTPRPDNLGQQVAAASVAAEAPVTDVQPPVIAEAPIEMAVATPVAPATVTVTELPPVAAVATIVAPTRVAVVQQGFIARPNANGNFVRNGNVYTRKMTADGTYVDVRRIDGQKFRVYTKADGTEGFSTNMRGIDAATLVAYAPRPVNAAPVAVAAVAPAPAPLLPPVGTARLTMGPATLPEGTIASLPLFTSSFPSSEKLYSDIGSLRLEPTPSPFSERFGYAFRSRTTEASAFDGLSFNMGGAPVSASFDNRNFKFPRINFGMTAQAATVDQPTTVVAAAPAAAVQPPVVEDKPATITDQPVAAPIVAATVTAPLNAGAIPAAQPVAQPSWRERLLGSIFGRSQPRQNQPRQIPGSAPTLSADLQPAPAAIAVPAPVEQAVAAPAPVVAAEPVVAAADAPAPVAAATTATLSDIFNNAVLVERQSPGVKHAQKYLRVVIGERTIDIAQGWRMANGTNVALEKVTDANGRTRYHAIDLDTMQDLKAQADALAARARIANGNKPLLRVS